MRANSPSPQRHVARMAAKLPWLSLLCVGLSLIAWGYFSSLQLALFAAAGAVLSGHVARRNLRRAGIPFGRKIALSALAVAYPLLVVESGLLILIRSATLIYQGLDSDDLVVPSHASAASIFLSGRPPDVSGAVLVEYPSVQGVRYHDHGFFGFDHWRFNYPGFRRTSLSADEANELLGKIRAGTIFDLSHARPIADDPPDYQEHRDRFRHEFDARISHNDGGPMGALVFRLADGSYAFARVMLTNDALLFYSFVASPPEEKAAPTQAGDIVGMSAQAAAYFRTMLNRIHAEPIPVMYKSLDDEGALDKGSDTFGAIYCDTARDILKTQEVIAAVGAPPSIRPAVGPSFASYLMGYSATFLFRVNGPKGEAAVRASIVNSKRELELVSNGALTKIPPAEFKSSNMVMEALLLLGGPCTGRNRSRSG
jgi:hypothetical protein